MWKSIREGAKKFFGQVVYNVGDCHRISFWHDPWCGSNPLKDLFPDQFTRSRSKRLGFLTSLYLPQKGETGAGIFISVELQRIGSRNMSVLSLSFCIPICRGVRGMIL